VLAWQDSSSFNELALLPGLSLEGEWDNEPLRARQAVLNLIRQVPSGTWWSVNAFVAWVRDNNLISATCRGL
jgi:hypothetical protein